VRDRSRLALVAAATAIVLVTFLPKLSLVVAQNSSTGVTFSAPSATSTTASTFIPVLAPTGPITSILLQLGTATAGPGDSVGGSGQGSPNTDITLSFCSTCVLLGTVHANQDGNFVFVFNVPLNVGPGLHTVQAVGPNGEQGTANLTVTGSTAGPPVAYPPILPLAPTPVVPVAQTSTTGTRPAFTGVNVNGLIVLAGAVLALGGMAFTFGRLEPAIVLPRRRRLQWAHRRRRSG
jgi:hypothetical protein